MLHEGKEVRVDSGSASTCVRQKSSTAADVEEIESNAFATAVSMPESFLRKDMEDLVFDVDDEVQVKALAKRYQVSQQAMTLRLVNLLSRGRL